MLLKYLPLLKYLRYVTQTLTASLLCVGVLGVLVTGEGDDG